MTTIYTTRYYIFLGLLLVAAGAFVVNNIHTTNTTRGKVAHVEFQYEDDFSDGRILMGAFHNVFVGKVLKEVEAKPLDRETLLQTNFLVHVVSEIKGQLNGNVVVKQIAGVDAGEMQSGEGNELLQSGSTYVLATRGDGSEGFYVLGTNPYAEMLVTTDSTLSDTQLISLAESNNRVKSLEVAYPDENPMREDVLHNFTVNSFQSLPPEAKSAAVARADAARAWLETNKTTR